jgi:hypothetical protein
LLQVDVNEEMMEPLLEVLCGDDYDNTWQTAFKRCDAD